MDASGEWCVYIRISQQDNLVCISTFTVVILACENVPWAVHVVLVGCRVSDSSSVIASGGFSVSYNSYWIGAECFDDSTS